MQPSIFASPETEKAFAIGQRRLSQLRRVPASVAELSSLRRNGNIFDLIEYLERDPPSPLLVLALMEQLFASTTARAIKGATAKHAKTLEFRMLICEEWRMHCGSVGRKKSKNAFALRVASQLDSYIQKHPQLKGLMVTNTTIARWLPNHPSAVETVSPA